MAIFTKAFKVFKCNICGYEWQRKKKASRSHPTICPECKNPKWNKAELLKTPPEVQAEG